MDVLHGKVAVVTGGGSGIGRALAEALAREGARLVVADVEEPAASAVAWGIRGRGGDAIAVRTDVSDLAQVQAFLPRMIAQRQPGHVVNTGSMAGLIASQGLGAYNASKYAVVGISETLVKDLRPHGIGVSVLCPMGVSTQIGDSARNRPAHLRNDEKRVSAEVQLIGKSLDPEAVAAMTVSAIRANRLYIITHDESLEPLRRRFQRLEQAILDRPR